MMSTIIKASCPECGEIVLSPEQIELRVCENAPRSYYEFSCPSCADSVRKDADDHVVSLLISAAVPVQRWALPLEAIEPHFGDPFTPDDLLEFALALAGTEDLMDVLEDEGR